MVVGLVKVPGLEPASLGGLTSPTTNGGGMQTGSSDGIRAHVARRSLHVACRLCNAQLVLSNKISASELGKKSIKSALLVGKSEEKNGATGCPVGNGVGTEK